MNRTLVVTRSAGFIGAAFLFALLMFTPCASAVILIVVLDPLTLFEIEGIDFVSYSTSERGTLRFENTDTGDSALVDLQGQTEARSHLTLCAFSRDDPRQKVRLEIEMAPLASFTGGAGVGTTNSWANFSF